jgi:hypothetical protein
MQLMQPMHMPVVIKPRLGRMTVRRLRRSLFAFCRPDISEFHALDFYFCIFAVGRTIMSASYRSLSFIEA